MSVIKETRLEKPRSFKVRAGYTVHMGNGVICESGAVILAGTQETLDVIMSQKWKLEEQFPETLVATPAPAVASEPEATVEGVTTHDHQEEPKEEPKAQAAQKFQRSRRAR